MNEAISDEEQEQFRQMMMHYKIRTVGSGTAAFLIFFSVVLTFASPLFLFPVLIGVIILFIMNRSLHHFARGLSTEERQLLSKVALSAAKGHRNLPCSDFAYIDFQSQSEDIYDLLKKAKIDPQKELLRPSQQSQNDILLRAAAYADTTPREQLLRPSTTREE